VLVRSGYDGARVYAASGRLVTTLRVRGGTSTSGAFSPDGTLVATATATGPVQVWRLPTGRLVRELRGHKPTDLGSGTFFLIRRVEFSADGRRLLTAGYDGTARIWDVGTWTTLRVLRPQRAGYLEAATFSPDGKLVATASGTGGRVGIWDSDTGGLVRTIQTRGGQFCATFSADSKLLVTCGGDGVARIWNVDSGERQLALRGHSGWVLSGTFSPDGTLLATTGLDGTARVWDTATGAAVAVVNGVRGYPAVFSSDGSMLAAAGSLVEARTGDPIANVAAVGDPIVSALSPDGSLVATMGFDGVGALLRCDLCRPLPQLLELAKQREGSN
jgi:WD40 repeat protein